MLQGMSACRTSGLLLSSLLLAACGTTVVHAGGGGSGTGGSGTGGACTETGDHTLSGAGLSTACTQDSDCIAVYFGDGCSDCFCNNAAIAVSAQGAYASEQTAKKAGCCPQLPCGIDCAATLVSCHQGTCVLGSG
jgi:hypothetical protein